MIKAEIIADSLGLNNTRLTTFVVTFPRIVLAEFNTHRMFSRNSASSRAIPFKKMVQMVQENPFIPIAWQKSHKGMQGTKYFKPQGEDGEVYPEGYNLIEALERDWLRARDHAIDLATHFHSIGVTKQLTNRLLEPFMWHKVIITSSRDGLENFFKLRCPQYWFSNFPDRPPHRSKKDAMKAQPVVLDNYTDLMWLNANKSQAEIHIQALAEAMWDAYNASSPKQLASGEWHVPFGDNIDEIEIGTIVDEIWPVQPASLSWHMRKVEELKRKVAVARCARISYQTFGDNPETDYRADIKLHDRLKEMEHMSPFEHVAKCMSWDEFNTHVNGRIYEEEDWIRDDDDNEIPTSSWEPCDSDKGWCRNFRGFIPQRDILE